MDVQERDMEAASAGIQWLSSLDEAFERATELGRPVLLELYDKECGSCVKLEATTLHDPVVTAAIRSSVIPVRMLVRGIDDGPVAARYLGAWTPTVSLLSATGEVHRQWVGYQPPNVFILQLDRALAAVAMREGRYGAAADIFDRLAQCEYDDIAAEALYYGGMARYRDDQKLDVLIATWLSLHERFPASSWRETALIEPPGEWPEGQCGI